MSGRLREYLLRMTAVVRPARTDADIEEELRSHLHLAVEAEDRGTGVDTASSPARRAALRAGGVDQAMEAVRDQRGLRWLMDLGRDAREAVRLFTRTPGVAALAVASIGLSLALGLVVLRVANGYLIRAFPYPAPERLYSVVISEPGGAFARGAAAVDWAALDDMVAHHIAWDLDMFYLLGGEYPEAVTGAWVTPGFFSGLGVRVALGTPLGASDFTAGGPTSVLISDRVWRARFSADPQAIGHSFEAYFSDRPDEAATLKVAGVLAPDFWHLNTYTDILAPLRTPAPPYLVSLRAGVSPSAVAERIDVLAHASIPDLPEGWRTRLEPAQSRYLSSAAPLIYGVMAAVTLVVVIASANVAILLLVRAIGRRHEMAVRLALGASRAHLARLIGLEALLLGGASVGAAWLVSGALLQSLLSPVETHLGRRIPGGIAALGPDGLVVAATCVIGALVVVVLAVVPLTALSLPSIRSGMASGDRGGTVGPAAGRLRSLLVAGEVAGALALLVGATLMIDSTRRLLREDLGHRTDIVSRSVALRRPTHPDPVDRAGVLARVLAVAAEQTPGHPVALSATWPLQPGTGRTVVADDASGSAVRTSVATVSAGYFHTLGIALRDGHSFGAHDSPGGAPVAVASESLARRLWPHDRAVGQRVFVPDIDANGTAGAGISSSASRPTYSTCRAKAPLRPIPTVWTCTCLSCSDRDTSPFCSRRTCRSTRDGTTTCAARWPRSIRRRPYSSRSRWRRPSRAYGAGRADWPVC